MEKIETKKLIELIPGDKFSKEEIITEISLRLFFSKNEKETQILWKRFKEL